MKRKTSGEGILITDNKQSKLKTDWRKILKSNTKNSAEGRIHQVRGKIKETIGKVVNNHELEIKGKVENAKGKIQEKVGEIEKIIKK